MSTVFKAKKVRWFEWFDKKFANKKTSEKISKALFLIANYSLLISPCSYPNFEDNHEHVSRTFRPKNRLPRGDRKNAT